MRNYLFVVVMFIVLITQVANGQQDPQFTQYMYNTQIVNPAYAGSREALNLGLLGRTQWVNFEGSPKTATFTLNTPVGALRNMGLGLSIVHDEIGPSVESNINIDYSYTVKTGVNGKLAFGLKAGIDLLNVDFTKLNVADGGDIFANNIDNRLLPQLGAGVYYYTNSFYAGLSVPNFLETEHFETSEINEITGNSSSAGSTIASEKMTYFFITGYVFDISENLKFKPATLVKVVNGAPLQWDVSANFLLNNKFTLGASYRWSAGISALTGINVSKSIFLGFAYDYQTTDIQNYSNGSYEFFLTIDIFNNPAKILTPRFF